MFLLEYDVYIQSFLEMLNLRFAPPQPSNGIGGVQEMAELERKFKIFASGHSFRDCAAVLGLGGSWNWEAKNRWFTLLNWLDSVPSETAGEYGGPHIVKVIAANLASANPVPIHFTQHDMAQDPRVLVRFHSSPLFYLRQSFITISFPMGPKKQ